MSKCKYCKEYQRLYYDCFKQIKRNACNIYCTCKINNDTILDPEPPELEQDTTIPTPNITDPIQPKPPEEEKPPIDTEEPKPPVNEEDKDNPVVLGDIAVDLARLLKMNLHHYSQRKILLPNEILEIGKIYDVYVKMCDVVENGE